jgi:putative two-component system response regulator
MTVVVIDDEVVNLVILKRIAASACGASVQGFTSAIAAIDYLQAHKSTLVVVDFDMPDCDGIDFITRVRADPVNKTTPILMVTGAEDPSIRHRAMHAGASAFLSKPVNWAVYKAELKKWYGVENVAEVL